MLGRGGRASALAAFGVGIGLGAVLIGAVLAVSFVSGGAPSRELLLAVAPSSSKASAGASRTGAAGNAPAQDAAVVAKLALKGLQHHQKRLAALRKQSAEFHGVDLDKVYKKAFNAAFLSAYRSTYKSALGKAEQKLWKEEEKGMAAGQELRALERYKELTQLSSKERTASGSQKVPMPQHRTLCDAGNCEPLESKGVNVDSAGLDFRGVSGRVPWPEDLGAAIERNTRKGKYAQFDHGDYSAPSPWGGAISNDPMKDPTNDRLEKHGVNVGGGAFMDALYKATPALSLDPTQFNRAARRGRSPFVSAEEARRRNRAQDERLMGAGVAVNRSPLALERRFRDYEDATVDGINDRLVPAGAKAPRWRVSGHVASEEPTHFLLRGGGGASVQQWRSDGGGLERKGPAATVAAGDLTAVGVNVDSWPA